jgi:hypothetical protein
MYQKNAKESEENFYERKLKKTATGPITTPRLEVK